MQAQIFTLPGRFEHARPFLWYTEAMSNQPPLDLRQRILRAAWLSILLGLALEAVLILLAVGMGTLPSLRPILADTVQKVSWSFLVCVGLVIGTGAAREGVGMGLMGLLAAPFGFYAARALHKAAQSALDVTAGAAGGGPSPLTIALIKGVEYAFLGAMLGWYCVGKRETLRMHAWMGLLTGAIFGGIVLRLSIASADPPLSAPAIVARAVNEMLFPLGCALVVFAARRFGEQIELQENL
jgi:hypothetical protein